MISKRIILAGLGICLSFSGFAQDMSFEEYEPKSGLTVPEHPVTRAKYPFIDVHNHQNGSMSKDALQKLVKDMDGLNLQIMVNLSGGTGYNLKSGLTNMKGNYPTRFLLFANVDFKNIDDPDFGPKAAAQLEQDVKNGAQGLKIFKNLGLTLIDQN
jgi:uncharacterized protein